MNTLVLQIGNSDDKLSQQEWSEFVECIDKLMIRVSNVIHFAGVSCGAKPWQNACWVIHVENRHKAAILIEIKEIRNRFKQDSAVVIFGDPQFV